MHYESYGASQSSLVSFLRGSKSWSFGQWVSKHCGLDEWAREMPNCCDLSNNNNLGRRECRGNHVHAAAKCFAHPLNRVACCGIASLNQL
jgi:hypothetical protein